MITMAKRMLAMLTSVMLIFNLSGCGETEARKSGENRIDEIIANMTLEEKIEQMMFVSYRTWKEVPESENVEENVQAVNITELNDAMHISLQEHHYGGILLFSENFKDADQTLRLIADIQQTNLAGGGLPLLVAADQEGGNVARIGFGTTGVGNMALAATGNADNAKSMASIYGEELALLGLNTDFAPVMDVNNNPNNPVIGVRSFSDSPEMVAEYGIRYMEGLHETGTIVTLKHFPGHGNTDTDSHTGFPCIMNSYEELKECELIPFQKAIDSGADMVMTAHIQYPEIEMGTYTSVSTGEQVYLPATMSSRILTDILRDDMGFEGVVVSDALEMAAISDNFKMEDVLSLTINAGVNMLIVPSVLDSNGLKKLEDMTDMASKLAEEGKIDKDRIDDSVRIILELKEKYGLLSLTDFTVTNDAVEKAVAGTGNEENREKALGIARNALTLVKNNEVFPIKADENQSILVLFADSCASRAGTGELVKQELLNEGLINESQFIVMVNDNENRELCEDEALKADYCILVYRTYNTACLNPETDDGFSSAVFDGIIEKRHEANKKSILISCQLPYDAARFVDADAILIAYNSAVMQEIPPASGEGSAYAPNLEAALMACFDDGKVTGQLPVNIPVLDENYQMTDEILYERNK
ncbi:MAG: hypothetical protein K6E91_00130 [Butyrivibrio sp.]|nr:hypothetical protein [Butyrivibrio sp.]